MFKVIISVFIRCYRENTKDLLKLNGVWPALLSFTQRGSRCGRPINGISPASIHPFSAYPKGGSSGSRLSGLIRASFSLATLSSSSWGTSALSNTKEQQLCSNLPTDVWVPHPIFEAQPLTGETSFQMLVAQPCPFGHDSKLMTMGKGQNEDRRVNQEIKKKHRFRTVPALPRPPNRLSISCLMFPWLVNKTTCVSPPFFWFFLLTQTFLFDSLVSFFGNVYLSLITLISVRFLQVCTSYLCPSLRLFFFSGWKTMLMCPGIQFRLEILR